MSVLPLARRRQCFAVIPFHRSRALEDGGEAGPRDHGTTRTAPLLLFKTIEQPAEAHARIDWMIDGKLLADLLDSHPWQIPDLLLEAEDYSLRRAATVTLRTSALCGAP